MKLFDLLLGKPSPDQFARKVQRAFREAGEKRPIAYDADAFALHIGGGDDVHQVYLGNVYEEYLRLPRIQRPQLLLRFIHGVLSRPQFPRSFEEARDNLLPIVRDRFYYSTMDLQGQLGHFDKVDIPHQPLASHLAVELALDTPNAIMSLGALQFQEWQVTFDDVLPVARDNLWRISNESWRRPAGASTSRLGRTTVTRPASSCTTWSGNWRSRASTSPSCPTATRSSSPVPKTSTACDCSRSSPRRPSNRRDR